MPVPKSSRTAGSLGPPRSMGRGAHPPALHWKTGVIVWDPSDLATTISAAANPAPDPSILNNPGETVETAMAALPAELITVAGPDAVPGGIWKLICEVDA